jgi:hypothetical protein
VVRAQDEATRLRESARVQRAVRRLPTRKQRWQRQKGVTAVVVFI